MHAVSDNDFFPEQLLSPEVSNALPVGYKLRALRRSDWDSGFLDCLRVLTTVGDISEEDFSSQYDRIAAQRSTYIIVIEDNFRQEKPVVATGAIIVESKFIHNLGRVGHIEDIAVAKDQQGKRLGLLLIQALQYIADELGCYKCILDCSPANEGFYEKCDFHKAGTQMAYYFEGAAKNKQHLE